MTASIAGDRLTGRIVDFPVAVAAFHLERDPDGRTCPTGIPCRLSQPRHAWDSPATSRALQKRAAWAIWRSSAATEHRSPKTSNPSVDQVRSGGASAHRSLIWVSQRVGCLSPKRVRLAFRGVLSCLAGATFFRRAAAGGSFAGKRSVDRGVGVSLYGASRRGAEAKRPGSDGLPES